LTPMWEDYGDWDIEPGYAETLNQVVQQAVNEQANFLDGLAYTVAILWLLNGGIRNRDRRRWEEAVSPVLEAAHMQSAERGAGFSRTMHGLNTNSTINNDFKGVNFAANRDFQRMLERSRQYVDSPVKTARWHLSDPENRSPEPPIGPVKRAIDDAKKAVLVVDNRAAPKPAGTSGAPATAFVDAKAREARRYEESMQKAAARAAEQAVGDATRAYSIGIEQGAVALGTTVERYLKVPHAQACNWCFLVAGRGYRSAQSVARHSPVDKCGARAVWAPANRKRKGEAIVGNEDWQKALEDAGYGGVIEASSKIARGEFTPQDRVNVTRDIIPRPSDFQSAIDNGQI